ncbi:MAG TPA: HDOD domain-containing protein [Gemmataceae bacterium]|nr:HDOD domain-containing protein [Gemmataceae bacterium]
MYLSVDHDLLVRSAYQLPPLPQSAARLAHLLTTDDSDIREIISVIEYDPTLTMKLLRVANSAIGGSRHRIGTVREALIRLGTGTVVGFVVASSVRPLLGKRIPGYNIPETEFWKHSLAAAFAAEAIQAHSANWTGRLAFTAALLHDIGKLVLGQFLTPELLAWLERAVTDGKQAAFQAEAEILSLHHGEAGGVIAQHWGLPDSIVRGIAHHHDPENGEDGICYVTYLANVVAHRLESDPREERPGSQPTVLAKVDPALEWLGLAEESLRSVSDEVQKGLQALSSQLD